MFGLTLPLFVLLRHETAGTWKHVASQAVFLVPLVVASVCSCLVALSRCHTRRSRLAWGLLAASNTLFLLEEAAVAVSASSVAARPLVSAVLDACAVVAVIFLLGASAVIVGANRDGWRPLGGSLLDGAAVSALVFGIVHTMPAYQADPAGAFRVLLHVLEALSLFVIALIIVNVEGFRSRRWSRTLAMAYAVLGLAVGVRSVDEVVIGESTRSMLTDVSAVLLLTGYGLIMVSTLIAYRGHGVFLRTASRLRAPAAWPSVVLSTLALGSVVWLAHLALTGQGHGSVATEGGALLVATACLVGRTTLANAEIRILTGRSAHDAVTGVLGLRPFKRMGETLLRGATDDAVVAVYAVDLDGFARVNAARGFRGGDRCLAAVARALEAACGSAGRVFRLYGDEFVIVRECGDRADAEVFGRELCVAVTKASCDPPVTASIGVAVSPDDGRTVDGLLERAAVVRTWVKRHGKGRVGRWDERISEVVGVDARLGMDDRVGGTLGIARALLAAADARDPANHDHARNVASLCRLLAQDIGLPPDLVDRIEIAAVLHDVGKIALPDAMLGGRALSIRERAAEWEHCALGERLLNSLYDRDVPGWVRAHHERFDGNGYPDGLAGVSIPLEARIIALADAYDGMVSGKRYGAPMSKAAALQEIDLGIGTRFDPDLAERFITAVGTSSALGWSDEWVLSS